MKLMDNVLSVHLFIAYIGHNTKNLISFFHHYGGDFCQSLAGFPLDELTVKLIFGALKPATLEISLKLVFDSCRYTKIGKLRQSRDIAIQQKWCSAYKIREWI